MLFQPLTTLKYSKYYIFISCVWSLLIVFIVTGTLGILSHHGDKSMNSPIISRHSVCDHILYNNCHFLTLYIFTLYAISLFLMMSISSMSLYFIQVYQKTHTMICIQSLFCFKSNFIFI